VTPISSQLQQIDPLDLHKRQTDPSMRKLALKQRYLLKWQSLMHELLPAPLVSYLLGPLHSHLVFKIHA
jgi:hypothetical protein